MRVGIAADHGGFDLKHEIAGQLRQAGHLRRIREVEMIARSGPPAATAGPND